jgi:YidC/Oxa1 family membrane protein insertase
VFTQKTFKETGISIIAVSGAISLLCLPLYNVAEKWQQIERDTQKKLKPKIDKIKTVFRGDEQYMILSAYYRQNHYHPVYAMRNTFSLLIQIPFFIAAYTYLSHLDLLRGARFLFINNLGVPDALIKIGADGSLNLLPVLMTLINLLSGIVYTKGFPIRDKAQLYGMALIFLLLLYNSPAGLVLYWTLNNVFSLAKNCIKKTNFSKTILYWTFIAAFSTLDIYIIFHPARFSKRIIVIIVITTLLLFMIFINLIKKVFNRYTSNINLNNTALSSKRAFIGSAFILFLLSGLAIPASLIASSTIEFSFIEPYKSPLPFIGTTMLQSMGFFLLWFPAVYFFFSRNVKTALTLLLSVLSISALIDTFVFTGDYGFLTTTLIFSKFRNPEILSYLFNLLIILSASALCIILMISKRNIFFYSIQAIIIISLGAFSMSSIVKINKEFSEISAIYDNAEIVTTSTPKPVYHLSRKGKNVVVIMLDRGISGYVPYIFDEKPELRDSFSGFTWYPNCVSLGGYTLLGVPSLFGGYEYSPEEMQANNDRRLVEKYNEGLLVLPKLFLDNGFSVTVTDPTYAGFSTPPDLSIYDKYAGIHAENLHGRFLSYWQKKYPENANTVSVAALLKNNLIHFSFFKMSPLFCRIFIYDNGEWLTTQKFNAGNNELTQSTLDNYSMLEALPEITVAEDSNVNTYTAITNDLTHEPAFFEAPDYIPLDTVTNRGTSPFADENHYHVNMAALILLGKWFDYLKQQGIYDNTRIIIVSDHGWYHTTKLPDNFTLPNGNSLIMFNPLLMVKDFSDGRAADDAGVKADYDFMTQADVPYLASRGITNSVNPFTNSPLFYDKKKGVTISTTHSWEAADRRKYKWNIRLNEWLRVHDNIFDPQNWERAGR